MTLAILITLGVIVYFIVGRTIINLFEDNDHVDFDEWKGFAIFIFPLVLIWILIMESSDFLTDEIDKLKNNKK